MQAIYTPQLIGSATMWCHHRHNTQESGNHATNGTRTLAPKMHGASELRRNFDRWRCFLLVGMQKFYIKYSKERKFRLVCT